jgi:hypothetical protein
VDISPVAQDDMLKMLATVKTYNEAPNNDPVDAAKKKKRGK